MGDGFITVNIDPKGLTEKTADSYQREGKEPRICKNCKFTDYSFLLGIRKCKVDDTFVPHVGGGTCEKFKEDS